jgi:hypothetical protein
MIGNEETKKTAHSLTTSCNNGFFIDIIYIKCMLISNNGKSV